MCAGAVIETLSSTYIYIYMYKLVRFCLPTVIGLHDTTSAAAKCLLRQCFARLVKLCELALHTMGDSHLTLARHGCGYTTACSLVVACVLVLAVRTPHTCATLCTRAPSQRHGIAHVSVLVRFLCIHIASAGALLPSPVAGSYH